MAVRRDKVLTVKLAPLEAEIHIVITTDPNAFIDKAGLRMYVSHDPQEDLTKDTDAFTFNARVSDYYIMLSPQADISVIAHEAVHCIAMIFDDRGEKADYNNNEIFAYHVGWLTKVAYTFLNEKR
jgi:hypothetical protein